VYVLACMAALSLPSHGDQEVSPCSHRSETVTAHSCVCACMHACGAVSVIAWRPGCKSLLFPQRSTHGALVCMCMHAALSLPSHVEQYVSLCSSSNGTLTAYSFVYVHACMHAALSLPSHGQQAVSLCSSRSAAQHLQPTRAYVHTCMRRYLLW
jgi:hypothetical protein